jgi:hypothetical protein
VTGDENQEFTVSQLVTSSFSKAMGLRKILELGKFDKQVDEILQLMQLVALHNQLNQKRIFSQKDVETALAKKPEFLPIWMTFVKQGDVPFVKIVADGEDAEYQFRHLSFQEALAAQVLADSGPVGIEAGSTGRPCPNLTRYGGDGSGFGQQQNHRALLRNQGYWSYQSIFSGDFDRSRVSTCFYHRSRPLSAGSRAL